jgi:hypothetical protein
MRAELAAAVAKLFAGPLRAPRPLDETEAARLVATTELVVRCRSAVERDSYSREVELIPDPEAPTRLVVMLERLLSGLDTIGVDRADAWAVLSRVALDSIPALRLAAVTALDAAGLPTDTTAVAETVRYPTTTARRALEDLHAHGIVIRHPGGDGKADRWELTEWARERLTIARETFPDLSSDTLIVEEESKSPDISGTVDEELDWR